MNFLKSITFQIIFLTFFLFHGLILFSQDDKEEACHQKLIGTLFLNGTQKRLGNALISLKDVDGNTAEFKTNDDGKYHFLLKCDMVYSLNAFAPGYTISRRIVSTSSDDAEIIKKNLFASKKGAKKDYVLIGEVDFEYNKWDLLPENMGELNRAIKAMKDNPKLFIHFESHTDSRAESDFNLELTDKRIAILKEYLGFKKIFRTRVSGQSFGETKPLNKCVKGVKCTDAEYLENRRTTFILTEKKVKFSKIKRNVPKVVVKTDKKGKKVAPKNCNQKIIGTVYLNTTRKKIKNALVNLKDSDGKVLKKFTTDDKAKYHFNLKCNSNYSIEAIASGYDNSERIVITTDKNQALINKNLFVTKALKDGEKREYLAIGEVDFDYNEWQLEPAYMYELDKAIAAMKDNPKLFIHFESHTDSRADSDFNLALTDKRIAVLKEYLGFRKIFRKRVSGQSFGETRPVNKCVKGVKCTDAEYLENRRTTFILTEKKVEFEEIKRDTTKKGRLKIALKNCHQKLVGNVFLGATRKKVGHTLIKLKDDKGEVLKETQTNEKAKYQFDLKCHKNYELEVSKSGFETATRKVVTSTKDLLNIKKNLYINPILEEGVKREPLLVGEVDFDYNEWELEPAYMYELDRAINLMKENPKLFIHFESHTDSRADSKFNLELTDKRIAMLKEYLAFRKIFRTRVSGQSFGEMRPVNKCVKGVKCTDAEYLENRRTTFILTENKVDFEDLSSLRKEALKKQEKNCNQKIEGIVYLNATRKKVGHALITLKDDTGKEIGTYKTDKKAKYHFDLKCNKKYELGTSIPGYINSKHIVTTSKKDQELVKRNLYVNTELQKGQVEGVLFTGEVDFEYNKTDLLPRFMYELDKAIVTLKDNPNLFIHFESHTDSRADSQYNMDLTKKRIAVLKEYLGFKKIFRKRVSGQAFGETKPLNKCVKGVKCTDSEYLENRRTTFIITEKKVEFTPIKEVPKTKEDLSKEKKEVILKNCNQKLKGTVFLNATRKKVGHALISLKDHKGKLLKTFKSDNKATYHFDLKCFKSYEIEASLSGYETSNRLIKTNMKNGETIIKNLFVTKELKDGEKRDYLYIGEVDFEYNKWDLLPRNLYELDKAILAMKDNPKLVIHFESHTDSRAETAFNKELTDKRIAVLKEYLGFRKIFRTRVTGESFGETKPLNKCVKGVKCTDEQYLINRRTTFTLKEKE